MLRFFLLIFFFSIINTLSVRAINPDTLNHIKSCVVYIEVAHEFILSNEDLISSGSGFFISNNGCVVTNYHVIQDMITIYNINFPAPVSKITVYQNSGTKEFKTFEAKIIVADKENDLAILGLTEDVNTPCLTINDSSVLIESIPVWAFGYPYGEVFSIIQKGPEVSVNQGNITALRHNDNDELRYIQTDAVVKPGNSGGPLVNANGDVLGVINLSYDKDRINFAIPCYTLSTLTKDIDTKKSVNDTVSFSVISNVPDPTVFIDWNPVITFDNKFTTSYGWHSVCVMKQGYISYISSEKIDSDNKIIVDLAPEINMVIPDTQANTKVPSAPSNSLVVTPADSIVLFSENFEDKDGIQEWRQNTGGTKRHTWFVEGGALHQYESDGMLHAISCGDSLWTDYHIEARVRITDNHNDSRAGIIFRETENGFYLFRIHKESAKAQLAYHSKMPFGWFILDEQELGRAIEDSWYSIEVNATGDQLSCIFDDSTLFTATANYSSKGNIGFYSVESKASFDSLSVRQTSNIKPVNPKQSSGILSFWFSDYFNAESKGWYQYKDDSMTPSPWISSEYGSIQTKEDNAKYTNEFIKYNLADFSAKLIVTLSKVNEKSTFEIFIRKHGDASLIIRFLRESNEVRLIQSRGNEEIVVKKEKLHDDIFSNTCILYLIADGKSIKCLTENDEILSYKGKKIAESHGRFGVSCINQKAILHQLTVASID